MSDSSTAVRILQMPAWLSGLKDKPLAMGRRFTRQGNNYTTVVVWLLRSALSGQGLKVLAIVLLSLAFIGSQAVAISTLYWYAQQLQNDGGLVVPLLGIDLRAREDMTLLALAICVSAIFFIASAGFLYLSRSTAIKVLEVTHKRELEMLVHKIASLPDPRAPVASRFAVEVGFWRLSIGCRLGGVTAFIFLNAVPTFIGAVGAAWFLIWLDPVLTLLILLAAALWAVLLYPITLRAVWFANRREKANAAFRQEAQELLKHDTQLPYVTEMATAGQLASAFSGRRRVANEMTLVVEIGIAVIVSVAMFYVVMDMMSGSGQWPILIAYVGALRLTLSGFLQAVQAYARVSRYYPDLVPYFLFMKNVDESTGKPLGVVAADGDVLLGNIDGSHDTRVEPGAIVALATSDSEQWIRLALIQARSTISGLPLQTRMFDPTGKSEAPLVLTEAVEFSAASAHGTDQLLGDDNNVVLIVHRDITRIGAFGESHILVAENGSITGFAPLGTPESEELIQAFKVARARPKTAPAGDWDVEEEQI
jgi:hypothetical protein